MEILLGTVEINKELTDYIQHLSKEVAHYDETVKWVKYQDNIPIDVTEDTKRIYDELKLNLDTEMERIKETVLLPYPNMKRFGLGEGIAYVWGE